MSVQRVRCLFSIIVHGTLPSFLDFRSGNSIDAMSCVCYVRLTELASVNDKPE